MSVVTSIVLISSAQYLLSVVIDNTPIIVANILDTHLSNQVV